METTRQTSIDCYNQILANGTLTDIRRKVFEGIMKISPCTSTELERFMNKEYGMKGTWKVLSWLREAGSVYELGTRNCYVTGRNVIEWDLTDRLPTDIPKKLSKKEKKEEVLNLIKTLGTLIPEMYKADLRVIYNKTKLL